MMTSQKVSVILLCGGQGLRMQNATPKQFLTLHNKIIATYSLDVFKTLPEVIEMVVVCELAYQKFFSYPELSIPLKFACPGKHRQDSVFNGLKALTSQAGFVCIHDSARPIITPPLVQRVLKAAFQHGAAAAGMPIKFTIKEHDGNHIVKQTPDRSRYWEVQTPQVIRKDILEQGFAHALTHHLEVTDDVSLAEHLGYPVKLVEGCYTNLKITTPEDLILAKHLLNEPI
ncbi:2-C-methyl-D-erythritol 4-phosphate cytidylyltransferase, chloroplastic|nr:2-C-methyl-D-erythritol 4-phosphate cytidylyltransferase, chloroplastic [Neochlamydia sp. AcF84]